MLACAALHCTADKEPFLKWYSVDQLLLAAEGEEGGGDFEKAVPRQVLGGKVRRGGEAGGRKGRRWRGGGGGRGGGTQGRGQVTREFP